MRALVVFESMFGNTQKIAEAVAEGLSSHMHVDLMEVGAAPRVIEDGIELLVVGGPTHAFGMSRERTRADAARQAGAAGVVSATGGLREWLVALETGSARPATAAFDTRINKPRVPGSAARAAERRLRRLGLHVVAPSSSFYVAGTSGPLLDGEQDRARRWGEEISSVIARSTQFPHRSK